MKKRIALAASTIVAFILAAVVVTSGCAPAKTDSSTSGGTSFFPNASI